MRLARFLWLGFFVEFLRSFLWLLGVADSQFWCKTVITRILFGPHCRCHATVSWQRIGQRLRDALYALRAAQFVGYKQQLQHRIMSRIDILLSIELFSE